MKKYLYELRRRHVVKSAIAYLVIAWLIIQVISILAPAFGGNQNTVKYSVIILLIGFPIWLIISWVYDFTPAGIVRTDESISEDDQVNHRRQNIRLNRIIIGGLLTAVVLLVFNQIRLSYKMDDIISQAASTDFESSIAVLPFKDLSSSADQNFFAQGLSIELLNELSKYRSLKVISSNSSFGYSNESNIQTIANELDVQHLVMGEVRQSGNLFRITVQLIETESQSLLWSGSYDEEVENVLVTQNKIAKELSNILNVSLTVKEVRTRKVNPEAFIYYLKANNALKNQRDSTVRLADSLINRAIDIDDSFAAAWAKKSEVDYKKTYYYLHLDREEGYYRGTNAAKRAIELDKRLPLSYVMLSNFHWRNRKTKEFDKNLKTALNYGFNDATTLNPVILALRKTNRLDEAYKLARKALELDPKNFDAYIDISWMESYLDKHDDAIAHLRYFISNVDNTKTIDDLLARAYFLKGDFDNALKAIEKEYFEFYKMVTKCKILYAMGRHQESDQLFQRIISRDFSIEEFANSTTFEGEFNLALACIYALRDEKDIAFNHLNKSFDYIYEYSEWFFGLSELNNLKEDERWDSFMNKLGAEFNYEF